MSPTAAPQLLDAYPLVRSRRVADASERMTFAKAGGKVVD